ncbi:hypothetical protein HKX48_007211, partial [Thoreauomyces humboldtii]
MPERWILVVVSTESLPETEDRMDERARRRDGDAMCRLIAGTDVVAIASRLLHQGGGNVLEIYVAANNKPGEARERLRILLGTIKEGDEDKMLRKVIGWNLAKIERK